ncbi:MAG: multicopper oxidase domain-containing protein, partial [Gammaproteobacteria bacterium]
MGNSSCDRRRFLGLAAGGTALTAFDGWGVAFAQTHSSGASLSPEPNPDFNPDVELELTAAGSTAQLLAGQPTRVWQYQGRVLKGPLSTYTTLPDSTMPVIRVRNGQKLRIFFHNALPEQTIVHWHGLHIVQKMDGHPMYAIAPGQQFVYEFEVNTRAGTYWFHPHPHERTGIQVYRGLVGLFIIEDEEETRANLPTGEFDLAWVIQDRRFNTSNQLVYAENRMDMMTGVTGNRILVNGKPDYIETMAATAYRVRLLNGSNSRFYKLGWSDGRPMKVIGADGGLLESAVDKPYVMLAPAERAELWLDLSDDKPGTELVLRSLSFDGGMSMGMGGMGMGGMGMRSGGAPANGAGFDVMKIQVDRPGKKAGSLPARLSGIQWPRIEDAVNRNNPRVIRLQMGQGRVSLNGRVFAMNAIAADERVKLGTTEIWEFANNSGMMLMSHPMHIHNVHFRVIERIQDPRHRSIYASMQDGLIDEALKDVVIVMPGERVRVLMKFADYTGLYLYHCHILE